MSRRRGIPFVVSAPSGTGKTTVCRSVVQRDGGIAFSISHTTRPARPGERDGADYHFVSPQDFRALVEQDGFVEYAEYAGNLYGTSWAAIDEPLARGEDLLLEVEVQGASQLRRRREDARFIFLLPPSLEELERRLRGRGTDDAEAIAKRLTVVRTELAAVHGFDYAVVNEDVGRTVDAVLEIIEAERAGAQERVRDRFDRKRVVSSLRDVLPIAPSEG